MYFKCDTIISPTRLLGCSAHKWYLAIKGNPMFVIPGNPGLPFL